MVQITKPAFTPDNFKIKAKYDTHGHFLSLRQYRAHYRRYDGQMSNLVEREVFNPPYTAGGILLYDPTRDEVALVEQFRFGPLEQKDDPWVIEIVMGMLDNPNEDAQTTAIREAFEEAGATVKRIMPMLNYYPSPGVSTEKFFLFCGEVDSSTLGGVHGLLEEDEDIRVVVLKLDDALQQVSSGAINSSSAIISLQWLAANKEHLWQ